MQKVKHTKRLINIKKCIFQTQNVLEYLSHNLLSTNVLMKHMTNVLMKHMLRSALHHHQCRCSERRSRYNSTSTTHRQPIVTESILSPNFPLMHICDSKHKQWPVAPTHQAHFSMAPPQLTVAAKNL